MKNNVGDCAQREITHDIFLIKWVIFSSIGGNSTHEFGCDVSFQWKAGEGRAELPRGAETKARWRNHTTKSRQTAEPDAE